MRFFKQYFNKEFFKEHTTLVVLSIISVCFLIVIIYSLAVAP